MRPLDAGEIVDLERYGRLRADYRERVILYKRNRRLPVGENVTLLFEDRETIRFQVQEMLWVERIADPARTQDEIDVYNELVPGPRELTATLFVEITELAAIKPELERLIGIDEHVSLTLGEEAAPVAIRARFDAKQLDEERIAAVQYIRFPFDETEVARFTDPAVPAHLRIDHPNYRSEVPLPPQLRAALIGTMCEEPEPLLRVDALAPEGPPGDEVIFASPTVRVIRPAHPRCPGHVAVEPVEPIASLLVAPPRLAAELLEHVRSAAAEVVRRHGSCRIEIDVGGHDRRLRWHVYPKPA